MTNASWFSWQYANFHNQIEQKVHFTLHPAREFSHASIFHSRVTFIFADLAAQQIYRWIKKTLERVHYYKF